MKKYCYVFLLFTHSFIISNNKQLTTEQLNACLFAGVTNGYLPTVELFIGLGAQVNCPAENTTPLMRAAFLTSQAPDNSAAKNNSLKIVAALLAANADTTDFVAKYAQQKIFKNLVKMEVQ